MIGAKLESMKQRIIRRSILDPNGCWIWQGALDRDGYGQLKYRDQPNVPSTQMRAHRASYLAFVGPIMGDLTIDHLCRVRRCVNPTHLEAVTSRENILRGVSRSAVNARKTRCSEGHEFEPKWNPTLGTWHRYCRLCRNAYMRAYNKRRRSP